MGQQYLYHKIVTFTRQNIKNVTLNFGIKSRLGALILRYENSEWQFLNDITRKNNILSHHHHPPPLMLLFVSFCRPPPPLLPYLNLCGLLRLHDFVPISLACGAPTYMIFVFFFFTLPWPLYGHSKHYPRFLPGSR